MGFFKELFAKRDEEAERIAKGGLKEAMKSNTQTAMNTELPTDQRREAFQTAKEVKGQIGNIQSEGTEMLKQEATRQNEALKAKLAARDAAKLEETRKAFEEGVDITASVDEGVDVDVSEFDSNDPEVIVEKKKAA